MDARKVYILAGRSKRRETNQRCYRRRFKKNFLDQPKERLDIAGKPLLQRSLENYLAVDLQPVLLGPESLQEVMTPEQRRAVSILQLDCSLGDKIRFIGSIDEPLHLATVDLVPMQQDLRGYLERVKEQDADLVIPWVAGEPLVENGFRTHLRNKVYVIKDDTGRIDHNAFSQFWSGHPSRLRCDWVAGVTDELYFNRWSLPTAMGAITRAVKTLRRDDEGVIDADLKDEDVLWTIGGMYSHKPWARITRGFWSAVSGLWRGECRDPGPSSYAELRTILSYCHKEKDASRVALLPHLPLPSLAMDIDWQDEHAIVDGLYRSGAWR